MPPDWVLRLRVGSASTQRVAPLRLTPGYRADRVLPGRGPCTPLEVRVSARDVDLQRWIAALRPKVGRIALVRALAPSTMKSRGTTLGSSPRSIKVVDQRLHDGGILGGAFDNAERMLVAVRHQSRVRRPGPGRCQHAGRQSGLPGGPAWTGPRPSTRPCARPREPRTDVTPPISRSPVTGGDRHIALGQTNRAPELARRYVDQHQVHRPAPSQSSSTGCSQLSSGSSLPLSRAPEAARLRPCHRGNRSFLACAPSDDRADLVREWRGPRATGRLLHHLFQRFDPGRQAELLERRRQFLPSRYPQALSALHS